MAAGSKPKYYLVEASVLPEIFAKVIEAKELLETGQVRTVADAVARVDISRSAFYKYKDFVSPFQDMSRGHLVTFNLELLDRQGVLSSVLAIFAENGANILTINQSIPTSGVAPVTITAATENMQTTMEAFMAALKAAGHHPRAPHGRLKKKANEKSIPGSTIRDVNPLKSPCRTF